MLHLEKSVWKTASAIGGIWLGLMIVPSLAQTKSSFERPPGSRVVANSPAGQVNRYVIVNYYSVALELPSRGAAQVTIMNNNDGPCDASVAFQFETETTDICVISLTIPAKQSRSFCSRFLGDPVAACVISCNPPLVFNAGHAYVRSTARPSCKNLSVDAQQYYTNDNRDETIVSQSRLTVTDLKGTEGD
jgi:hypothetical protein